MTGFSKIILIIYIYCYLKFFVCYGKSTMLQINIRETGLSERPEWGKGFPTYFFGNFKPKSVSIFLAAPDSRVTLLDENTSKHAEPGITSIETWARELNFLDLTFVFFTSKKHFTKSIQKPFRILK